MKFIVDLNDVGSVYSSLAILANMSSRPALSKACRACGQRSMTTTSRLTRIRQSRISPPCTSSSSIRLPCRSLSTTTHSDATPDPLPASALPATEPPTLNTVPTPTALSNTESPARQKSKPKTMIARITHIHNLTARATYTSQIWDPYFRKYYTAQQHVLVHDPFPSLYLDKPALPTSPKSKLTPSEVGKLFTPKSLLRIGDVVSITPRESEDGTLDGKVGGKGGHLTPEQVKELWLGRGKTTAKALLEAEASALAAKADAKTKTTKVSKENAAATRPPAISSSTSNNASPAPTAETLESTTAESPTAATTATTTSQNTSSPSSTETPPATDQQTRHDFFQSLSLHRLLKKSQPKHRTKLYQYYARSQSRKMITTRGSRGVKFVVKEVLTPVGYEMVQRVAMAREAQRVAFEAGSVGSGKGAGKTSTGKAGGRDEAVVREEETGGENSPWWKRKEGRGQWMMDEAAKHNATA
jgi:hypothetical protein